MRYPTNIGCLWLALFLFLIGGTPLLVGVLRVFGAFLLVAVVGAIGLTWWLRRQAVDRYARSQSEAHNRFVEVLVALLVRLAEVDGPINRGEVSAIRKFFQQSLGYREERSLWVRDLIKASRRSSEPVEALCAWIRSQYGFQERFIVIQVQEDAAARWQKEYDDLYASFRKAAARDTFKDSKGNNYMPILMANEGRELPQRGQWTFCHAVYPGQIFGTEDPLVASTLTMLEATEREGMVFGTGWDATGIWNYFASFYGHAWLWQGNGGKAGQALYAFANHASPTFVWREEQSLVGEKFRKVGDMPHNWASAEFIRLTIHLLIAAAGTIHQRARTPAVTPCGGPVSASIRRKPPSSSASSSRATEMSRYALYFRRRRRK